MKVDVNCMWNGRIVGSACAVLHCLATLHVIIGVRTVCVGVIERCMLYTVTGGANSCIILAVITLSHSLHTLPIMYFEQSLGLQFEVLADASTLHQT